MPVNTDPINPTIFISKILVIPNINLIVTMIIAKYIYLSIVDIITSNNLK